MRNATFAEYSHSLCDFGENLNLRTQKDPGTGKWIPLLRASDHQKIHAFFCCYLKNFSLPAFRQPTLIIRIHSTFLCIPAHCMS